MKKKILFIMNSLNYGGAEKALISLLNAFDYNKYDVSVLLLTNGGKLAHKLNKNANILKADKIIEDFYLNKNIFLYILKMFITFIMFLFSFNKLAACQLRWKFLCKKIFKKLDLKYDIAVSYLHGDSTYFLVDKVTASKKITWVHIDYLKTKRNIKFDREYFKNMDYLATISDECLNSLQKTFSEKKCVLIPNIVSEITIRNEANAFYPTEYENKNNIFLTIGRLCAQKGYDFLLKVANELTKYTKEFHWFIIGDGELKNKIQKDIENKGLQNNVSLLGVRENPYPYIKNANIIVQTSRYEGKSIFLDEAKILKKAIVSTDYSTVFDQIIDNKEGIICEGDEIKFAKTLYNLLCNEKKINNLENYLSQNNYGNEQSILKYYEIFES